MKLSVMVFIFKDVCIDEGLKMRQIHIHVVLNLQIFFKTT